MATRDQLKQEIVQCIRTSLVSGPGTILLTGPAGIGKTTLLQTVLSEVSVSVFEAQMMQKNALPYGPFINIIRRIFELDPAFQQKLKLNHHLHLIIPEIDPPAEKSDKNELFSAIREVFSTYLQKGPMIFVIEDIHLMDAVSCEILTQLLTSLSKQPLVILGTYRSDAFSLEHPFSWLKNDLRRIKMLKEWQIPPLSVTEAKHKIEALLQDKVDEDALNFLYAQSQGIPLFLEELTKSFATKGYLELQNEVFVLNKPDDILLPETIREMIVLQMDGISDQARGCLEIAATIGEEFDLDILSELLDDDCIIDELLQKQLIFEKKPGVGSFKHRLIPEAVKSEILWSQRKQLNCRIAEALQQRNFPAETVAEYWSRGGQKEKARLAYMHAALFYCSIHAHRDSASASQKALDLWPTGQDEDKRLQILEQLAQCARINGQIPESIMALRELADSSFISNKPEKLADVYRSLAISYGLQGAMAQCRKYLSLGAELFSRMQRWHEATQLWMELANRFFDELEVSTALEYAEKAHQSAYKTDSVELQSKSLSLKGYILAVLGQGKEGKRLASQAVNHALSQNHIDAAAYAYRKLAGALEYDSDFKSSIQAYDTALNFCHNHQLDTQAQFCMSCMGWVVFRLGDLKRALEVAKSVIEHPEVNQASKSIAHTVTGVIKAYRGEFKSAHRNLGVGYQLAQRASFKIALLLIHWSMAILHEMEKHLEKAYSEYHKMLAVWETSEDKHDILCGLFTAATFMAENHHSKELNKIIQILSGIANETNNPEVVGTLAYALAVGAYHNQDYENAQDGFSQALKYYQELDVPLQVMEVQKYMGLTLLKLDNKEEAKEKLLAASSYARNLGLRPFLIAIDHLLSESSPKEAQDINKKKSYLANENLTRRQREILEQLAAGFSNKEIAANLHLSTRTVDMHVSNILIRFNCRSRTEAVKLALEEGILS